MPTRANATIDPATFKVLNHRLLNIVEEMGIQCMRCLGSNVLITGNDAATAIMRPDGALVSVGPYIVIQGNVLPLIVESTMRLAADVGHCDGEIFICNDPYLGAIHAPDFATVAPIYHDGELIAWIGASGHQLDTGGMDPGGSRSRRSTFTRKAFACRRSSSSRRVSSARTCTGGSSTRCATRWSDLMCAGRSLRDGSWSSSRPRAPIP